LWSGYDARRMPGWCIVTAAATAAQGPWMQLVPPVGGTSPPATGDSPQLLQRTFLVLSLFTPERQEWTVTEIGRRCELAVPTVHRILTALHKNGYLVRDDLTKRFRLGPTVLRMGRTAALAVDLRSLALPLLTRLAARTSQTALLTVMADDCRSAVCLERVESTEPLRLSVAPGRRLPLHAGASQKILLSYLPQEQRDEYFSQPLSEVCRSTITEVSAMTRELDAIRERGWASSCEETNLGVWGVSVALIDESGRAAASLGVAGPSERRPRNLSPWLALLTQSAACLAEPLGFAPSLHLPERRVVNRRTPAERPSHRTKESIR
jgi:DNA-binding IclR family transcriptional regulator